MHWRPKSHNRRGRGRRSRPQRRRGRPHHCGPLRLSPCLQNAKNALLTIYDDCIGRHCNCQRGQECLTHTCPLMFSRLLSCVALKHCRNIPIIASSLETQQRPIALFSAASLLILDQCHDVDLHLHSQLGRKNSPLPLSRPPLIRQKGMILNVSPGS